jgi:2'-5' RNA ligase
MTLLFHFKPHVTLGRVSAEKVSLDQLQNVLQSIKQPAFNCILNEAEHRKPSRTYVQAPEEDCDHEQE